MSRTAFCIDGPLTGQVIEVDRSRFSVVEAPSVGNAVSDEIEYHIHKFCQSTIDDETMAVVFPIWPFISWSEADADWARPMCKWTPTTLRRELFIGSIYSDPTSLAVNSSILLNVPPRESRYAIPPAGYCLAIDSQYR